MTDPIDTSAESTKRAIGMCKAAGLHGTVEKLRALLSERDALAAQVAEVRNAALDEAAEITEREGQKSRDYPGETIAETYCDDAAEIIRALKSGADNG